MIAQLAWQTFRADGVLLICVPRARDQSDPQRVRDWERSRRLVGQRIRELRVAGQMTQEALALKSGLSRNLLVDVELGKSGLLFERLFDLAAALGVPPGEFLAVDEGRASAPSD